MESCNNVEGIPVNAGHRKVLSNFLGFPILFVHWELTF